MSNVNVSLSAILEGSNPTVEMMVSGVTPGNQADLIAAIEENLGSKPQILSHPQRLFIQTTSVEELQSLSSTLQHQGLVGNQITSQLPGITRQLNGLRDTARNQSVQSTAYKAYVTFDTVGEGKQANIWTEIGNLNQNQASLVERVAVKLGLRTNTFDDYGKSADNLPAGTIYAPNGDEQMVRVSGIKSGDQARALLTQVKEAGLDIARSVNLDLSSALNNLQQAMGGVGKQ